MLLEILDLYGRIAGRLPVEGYALKTASFVVDLRTGAIAPLTTPLPPGKNGKPRKPKKGQHLYLPDLRRNNGRQKPLLAADNGTYVFGLGGKSDLHAAFIALLRDCWDSTGDAGIAAILDYLADEPLSGATEKELKEYQRGTFIFNFEGENVHERSAVRQFWEDYVLAAAETRQGVSAVSGRDMKLLSDVWPATVKGLPGSRPQGVPVSSINFPAGESYGTSDTDIGYSEAAAIAKTLTFLTGESRHNYKFVVKNRKGQIETGTVYLFWSQYNLGINPAFWDDPEQLWDDDPAEMAKSVMAAPQTGRLDDEGLTELQADDDWRDQPFYLAAVRAPSLAGGARFKLDSFERRPTAETAQSLIDFIRSQRYAPSVTASPIWLLEKACWHNGEPAHNQIGQALAELAVVGTPLPDSVAIACLNRAVTEFALTKQRIQLLSLFLGKEIDQMTDNERTAYYLGRISFLLHRAECWHRDLKGDKTAGTNVMRQLRALVTSPKDVFAKLHTHAIAFYLPGKVVLSRQVQANFAELREDAIANLPDILHPHEQASFALGWGKSEAEYWASTDTNGKNGNDPATVAA
ncbi:MAG: hypothetical protein HC838_03180 [Spirulinaceae cyanobacterium RM2_2_10]|nr:hypothetical protein [Spirulinaceae cyanobacterium SM2_1_0]NJO19261.1 hypothetical protein [Spirulinaceae cyanobacterium RM2_2_10]